MSTLSDIMDWESEISVKHKTKMFPNVKNGMNFCAKPHTHTITVRDYVILSYMENPVHLLILSLRQLILDHLEILCTSEFIWPMAWTIFGALVTCILLANLYNWIVILVILFYRLKSLIYSRATRVERPLFGCCTLNKQFTIQIDLPTNSGTYNFTVIIIFSSQESTSDRWLITCTSGGGSKNQAWKGIKDEPSIVSF